MRSITDVINQIENTTTSTELKTEMNKIKYDAGFKAPELMYTLWNELHFLLGEIYSSPFQSDESLNVYSIFTGRSIQELLEIQNEEMQR